MNFGEAIAALKQGQKVKRAIWGGYWYMSTFLGTPIIVARIRDNQGFAAAQPYQADLLAKDWEIVPNVPKVECVTNMSLQELDKRYALLRKKLYNMSPNDDEFMEVAKEHAAVMEQIRSITKSLGGLEWQPCIN